MRDLDRIYVFCFRLGELWARYCPDWRFTQLIDNIRCYYQSDLFYVEEDQALEMIEEYFKKTFPNK